MYGEQREESGWDGRGEKEGAGIQTAHFPLGSIRPSHYGGWAKRIGNGRSRLHRRVLLAFQALTELYNSFGGKAQKPRVSYWPVREREFELRGPGLTLSHNTWLYSIKRFFKISFLKGREEAGKSWYEQQLQALQVCNSPAQKALENLVFQRWRRQKTEVGRWLLILGTLKERRAVLWGWISRLLFLVFTEESLTNSEVGGSLCVCVCACTQVCYHQPDQM